MRSDPARGEDRRHDAPPEDRAVICPFCSSRETEVFSLFGSSPLTSQYYCRTCRTVFERVKWGAGPSPDAGRR